MANDFLSPQELRYLMENDYIDLARSRTLRDDPLNDDLKILAIDWHLLTKASERQTRRNNQAERNFKSRLNKKIMMDAVPFLEHSLSEWALFYSHIDDEAKREDLRKQIWEKREAFIDFLKLWVPEEKQGQFAISLFSNDRNGSFLLGRGIESENPSAQIGPFLSLLEDFRFDDPSIEEQRKKALKESKTFFNMLKRKQFTGYIGGGFFIDGDSSRTSLVEINKHNRELLKWVVNEESNWIEWNGEEKNIAHEVLISLLHKQPESLDLLGVIALIREQIKPDACTDRELRALIYRSLQVIRRMAEKSLIIISSDQNEVQGKLTDVGLIVAKAMFLKNPRRAVTKSERVKISIQKDGCPTMADDPESPKNEMI